MSLCYYFESLHRTQQLKNQYLIYRVPPVLHGIPIWRQLLKPIAFDSSSSPNTAKSISLHRYNSKTSFAVPLLRYFPPFMNINCRDSTRNGPASAARRDWTEKLILKIEDKLLPKHYTGKAWRPAIISIKHDKDELELTVYSNISLNRICDVICDRRLLIRDLYVSHARSIVPSCFLHTLEQEFQTSKSSRATLEMSCTLSGRTYMISTFS